MKHNEPAQTELMPATVPSGAVATRIREPFDIERLFTKAIEAKADVGTLERMMAIRREVREEEAKAAFDSAMRAFQAECPVIHKNRTVPDSSGRAAYSYAPFEDVLQQVRPFLEKHGFSFTLDTDVSSEAGWVIAKCIVTHDCGHARVSTAKFPLGDGTRIMSKTQVYASALTFASRRVFQNAFGIVTGGEDLDGRGTAPKPAGPAVATEKIKARFLECIADIKDKALEYAIDRSWIMPDQGLDDWPNEHVPLTKRALDDLRSAIIMGYKIPQKGELL